VTTQATLAHTHDRVAARGVEAGGGCDLVPEVARQRDDAQVRIVVGERLQHGEGGVVAPVVDQDHLIAGRRR